MLSNQDAIDSAATLLPQWQAERKALDRIDKWYVKDQEPYKLPRVATKEMKMLEQLSRTPWLALVVTSTAQLLFVDGWRSLQHERAIKDVPVEDRELSSPWRTWLENDLSRKQMAIHRAALAYGYSYASVTPGEDVDGGRAVVVRGISPREMFAVYRDPANDEWPELALRVEQSGRDLMLKLYDEECVYFLSRERGSDRITFIEAREHGVGVTPIARFSNLMDLEGRAPGEIEPYIPIARRINKTDHDRLVAQHFNSTVVRTVAGLAQPDDDQAKNQREVDLGLGKLLVAEDPDTKFGSLPATPLDGLIKAKEADLKTLSATSQTPTHELTGDLINLSAEALAAAKSTQMHKAGERKESFGGTWNQILRLGDHIRGHSDGAADFAAHVTWRDLESRSLSQSVDALGKAATMLGIPVEGLWGRIPGVTATDVAQWQELAKARAEADPMRLLAAGLDRQSAEV